MALSKQPENSGDYLLWCLNVYCYTSLYQEERLAGALVMLTAYTSKSLPIHSGCRQRGYQHRRKRVLLP